MLNSFFVRSARRQVALALLLALAVSAAPAAAPRIAITFSKDVSTAPYTGRVYVVTATNSARSPLDATDWFHPQPFFSRPVEAWPPDTPLRFDAEDTRGYPVDLAELPAGTYRVQAVLDLYGWSHNPIKAPGNGVSRVIEFEHDPGAPADVALTIDRRLPELSLTDTERVKYVKLRSEKLSAFHRRDVYHYAALGLPAEYDDEAGRRFPAVYVIPGFGGTIGESAPMVMMMRGLLDAANFSAVVVQLDADFPTGHHVFADSATNGPCGTALVTELIPHLERSFRLMRSADARFVTGVSSGGWASLWVQIMHPDVFGGVWSMSPDPVDFRAFMGVDIYARGANMLRDEEGAPRRMSRRGLFGDALVMADFIRMEQVLGRGGQFYSFDAVFSPRAAPLRPRFLWDRDSGRIDPEIAQAWKSYDVRRLLEREWATLGPKLRGKLYLYCGDADEFFLDEPFVLLRDTLRRLGSDATIEIVPEGSHMLPVPTWVKMAQQMKQKFEAGEPARQPVSAAAAHTVPVPAGR